MDAKCVATNLAGPVAAVLGGGFAWTAIDQARDRLMEIRDIATVERLDQAVIALAVPVVASLVQGAKGINDCRKKDQHSDRYAHGFIHIDTKGGKLSSEDAQTALRPYSRKSRPWPLTPARLPGDPKGEVHIIQVDLMDDPDVKNVPGKKKRDPGTMLIVEFAFNPRERADAAAHDIIMELSKEVAGLAGAPGAEKVFCCISDI